MELTYTIPEALRGQRFTASRDPSFSDVTDYLTLPSTVISGTSNVRKLSHQQFIIMCNFSSASESTF